MTVATAYHLLLDRIPRVFREAGADLAASFIAQAGAPPFSFTADQQAALETWHARLAAARAWSALQGARALHVMTTVRQHARQEPLTVGTFFSLPFDEALLAYLTRHPEVLIAPHDLYELYWERGATLAEAAAAQLHRDIHASLAEALRVGTPMQEWRETAAQEWGGRHSYYETVYRTNVAQAYSDGQRNQAASYPDVIGFRRLTTRDTTTRPNHRAAHGMVWRKDDPRADWLSVPWG